MTARLLTVTSALALLAGHATADNFNRIASFMVADNAPDAEESSAEIIAATGDGMTLVYTDSPAGLVGFIDLTDPAVPVADGVMALDGEPTSVAVTGMTAFVGENTSESYTDPSGVLHAIDVESRAVLATCDLGGQPDAVAIALDGEGGFWIASEGRSDRLVPHAIYHVGGNGAIEDHIALPEELLAVERRFGFEGITRAGDMLYIAVQREWRDDPENHAKVLGYNLGTEEWSVIHYPLTRAETGWVGLSEIVVHGEQIYFIERDNLFENASTKQVTRVPLAAMDAMVPLGEMPAVLTPELVVNLLPHLTSTGGYVLDKVEGLAIADDGTMWISTDNDGVDDHSGETMFFAIPPG